MVGLAQLLLKSNAGYCLIEDYAACLEQRSEWFQLEENTKDDTGVLIMRVRLSLWIMYIINMYAAFCGCD